jgi:chromosome segregation ATPase
VLQTERDEARKSLEDFRLKHHTDMESMKTKTVQAESARQGMEGRVAHLITENEKKDSAIRIAQTSASDADVTADQAKRELAQIESQMNNLRIELNKDSEDATIQAQAERAALLQQVDMANIKIRDRDETVRKLTRDIVEIQTRAETNESEIRRAHLSSVSGTRKRLAATELGYQDSIGKVHSTQKTLLEEEESHKAEMNSVRSELDRIRREKEALHDKLREAEHTAEGERRKIAVVRREAAGAKETHLVEMGEERERSKLLEATKYKVVELEAAVAALRGKLDDATSTNRSLSEDAVEKLRLLKESFTARVSGLDIEVRKEKKRADAYKSKALEAHNRAKYSA